MNIPSQKLLKEDQKKGIGWYVVNINTLIFCIKDGQLNILLEKREFEPENGKWIIPGKFLNYNLSPEDTVRVKLKEILDVEDAYIEQLYLFGNPNKSLGKRVVTSTYLLLVSEHNLRFNDSANLTWFPVKQLPELAFDSREIIQYALNRIKNKAEYTTIVAGLLPRQFRLTELQKANEIILEKPLNKRNFRTKILSMDVLQPTKKKVAGAFRPAMLYEFKERQVLSME
jgi:8-oxo-dGTP diphosphatase